MISVFYFLFFYFFLSSLVCLFSLRWWILHWHTETSEWLKLKSTQFSSLGGIMTMRMWKRYSWGIETMTANCFRLFQRRFLSGIKKETQESDDRHTKLGVSRVVHCLEHFDGFTALGWWLNAIFLESWREREKKVKKEQHHQRYSRWDICWVVMCRNRQERMKSVFKVNYVDYLSGKCDAFILSLSAFCVEVKQFQFIRMMTSSFLTSRELPNFCVHRLAGARSQFPSTMFSLVWRVKRRIRSKETDNCSCSILCSSALLNIKRRSKCGNISLLFFHQIDEKCFLTHNKVHFN